MLCALAALSALSFAEVEIPATVGPLGRVLPEIGAHLDLKLFAEASVRDDVVGIVSPKASPQSILDGIAKATNASWVNRPEGLVLVRSRRQELEDEEAEAKYREGWIRDSLAITPITEPFDQARADALAAYRAEFKSKKEFSSSDYAQLDTMNSRSPLGRFTRRLVEAMGVEKLARVPQRSVTVYSTRPTPMQRSLQISNLDSVIKTYTEEQNRYAAAVEKLARPQSGHVTTFVSGFDSTARIVAGWDKIRVSVDTSSPTQTFIYVEFCSAAGKTMSSARAYFNRVAKAPDQTPGPDDPINYDEDEKSLIKNLTQPPTLDENATIFETPVDERDPLDYVHRPALEAWSRATKKPIFALLSDDALVLYMTEPYRLGSYRSKMAGFHQVEELEAGIMIRPHNRTMTRHARINRVALQSAIKDRLTRGYITIESAMNLLSTRSVEATGVNNRVLSRTLRDIQPFQMYEVALRLLAIAEPVQRNALLEGATFTWRELNDAQRNLITRLLYDHSRSWGAGMTMMQMGRDAMSSEPTEVFPDGVPKSLQVVSDVRRSEGARFAMGNNRAFANAEYLAQLLSEVNPPKGRFLFAKQRSMNVKIVIEPTVHFGFHLQELQTEPNAKWGGYEALPKSLRDEANRILEKQRRVPPR